MIKKENSGLPKETPETYMAKGLIYLVIGLLGKILISSKE
jgi:hypothetical protein